MKAGNRDLEPVLHGGFQFFVVCRAVEAINRLAGGIQRDMAARDLGVAILFRDKGGQAAFSARAGGLRGATVEANRGVLKDKRRAPGGFDGVAIPAILYKRQLGPESLQNRIRWTCHFSTTPGSILAGLRPEVCDLGHASPLPRSCGLILPAMTRVSLLCDSRDLEGATGPHLPSAK